MFPEMKRGIYLDNNATTQLLPEVKEEMINVINTTLGNPSSLHYLGDISREIIRKNRVKIANFLNCREDNIIFTSGATESNVSVLNSVTYIESNKKTIITTYSEHASIKENCYFLKLKGFDITYLNLDKNGIIDLIQLETELKRKNTLLVSIGMASNETGVIQPIDDISELCKTYGCLFHSDISQYIGRGEINIKDMDFASFTGHKLHAPKGIGCLYIKNTKEFIPLFNGGTQEKGLRSGTENLIGIAGLGKAIELRELNFKSDLEYLKKLRDAFENKIIETIPDVSINGKEANRNVNTANLCFHGIDGRALLAQLDIENIYCSQTSACTSMIPEPSETLQAMGLTVDDAFASLRFSFAVDNTLDEIDKVCSVIKEKVNNIRKFMLLEV